MFDVDMQVILERRTINDQAPMTNKGSQSVGHWSLEIGHSHDTLTGNERTSPPMPDLPVEIDVLSVKQLRDRGEPFLLLDVRNPEEHVTARIEGSTLIPITELQSRLGELEPHRGQRIVVHCHFGGRSQRVTMFLRQQGFTQVQNMTGGIDAWSLQVDPKVPRYE